MIVIAILALPFVFYFNKTDLGAARTTDLGRIYDRPVTLVEFSRNAHLMNLANGLGLSLGNDLMTINVKTENEMYAEFTWNRLVMRHEAEQLGIHPNASEITAFVKTLARFQTETRFDMNKYTEFTQTMLPPAGFSEAQIEELVSDQLSLNRMKDLVGTGMQVPESENKENYEKAYGTLHVAVVRLQDGDFQKDVKITDDEIAKYYEANKEKLKSEEKRRVEFVTFTLTDAEKKLTGKERVDASAEGGGPGQRFHPGAPGERCEIHRSCIQVRESGGRDGRIHFRGAGPALQNQRTIDAILLPAHSTGPAQ